MPRKRIDWRIATLDMETDPFLFGRTPKPFAIGVYYYAEYYEFWGADCVKQLLAFLARQKPTILYAHNGGRFDFFYLLQYLSDPIRIINGRIVSARLGAHWLRDSFAILPVPLRAFGTKGNVDYARMEKPEREMHRAEISAYLKQDCIALWDPVIKFRQQFGDKLTVAGAAITELQKFHPIEKMTESHDAHFRKFYYGGRVEAFSLGVIPGDWRIYDANSMYPTAMARYHHPVGREYTYSLSLDGALRSNAPFFAHVDCTARGCFPQRQPDAPLVYPHARADYLVTGHELRAATSLGLVDVHKTHGIWIATRWQRFDKYVRHWYTEKKNAPTNTDAAYIFAKLMLNSAYGKFGANPENYYDYKFCHSHSSLPILCDRPKCNGNSCGNFHVDSDYGNLIILRRSSLNRWQSFFDVATAASITGAARAMLMRALAKALRPIYCDTDSIICERLGVRLSRRLGDWKREASGDVIAIGGRKLYSLRQGGKEVKQAAKGVHLTSNEIFDVARGMVVTSRRDAPIFSLTHPFGDTFVTRQVRMKP